MDLMNVHSNKVYKEMVEGISSLPIDRADVQRAEEFFDQLGARHVRTVIYRDGQRGYRDLSDFSPDIVFYTEQWSPCEKQDPYTVSKYALTFFAPYYVGDYCQMQLDCHQQVQR